MKNVLVLSLEPFTTYGSNGRALGSLLMDAGDDFRLAQVYFKSRIPDLIDCPYLLADEKDVFRSLYRFHLKTTNPVCEKSAVVDVPAGSFHGRNTAFRSLVRNALWKLASCHFSVIRKWCEEFRPDVIVFQDCNIPALMKYARKLAGKLHAQLVFYTTENYAFKDYDFMSRKKPGLFFRWFRKSLYRQQKKLVESASSCVFITEMLKEEYQNHYRIPLSYVIGPASTVSAFPLKPRGQGDIVMSYCGNLGVGRFLVLLRFAEECSKSNLPIRIHVCAPLSAPDAEKIKALSSVVYHGFVTKEEVDRIYSESDFLLHFESFDPETMKDCRHAFSGKLGECLSSGRPFVYYGPTSNATGRFLKEHQCAVVLDDEQSMKDFVTDPNRGDLTSTLRNAAETADAFFSPASCGLAMRKCLSSSLTFDYLVTTVRKTPEEIRSILDGMNVRGSLIVGNQMAESEEEYRVSGNFYSARVINMKSRGVSLNRNTLIAASSADYVSFFDDDMAFRDNQQEECERFVSANSGKEAIRFNVESDNAERPIPSLHKEGVLKFRDLTTFGVCGAYYRRDFLNAHSLRFRENIGPGTEINHGEDTVFNYDFLKQGRIYQHDSCPIHIRQTDSTWLGKSRNLEVEMISHGYNYYFFYGKLSALMAKIFVLTHKNCYPEGTDYHQLYLWMKQGIRRSAKENRK